MDSAAEEQVWEHCMSYLVHIPRTSHYSLRSLHLEEIGLPISPVVCSFPVWVNVVGKPQQPSLHPSWGALERVSPSSNKKSKWERDFPAVYKTSELFQGTVFQTNDYVAYGSSKRKGKVEFLGRETNSFSALENPKPKEKHPSFSLLPGSCKFRGRILSKWDTVCKVMICTPFRMDNLFGVNLSCPKPTDGCCCLCNGLQSYVQQAKHPSFGACISPCPALSCLKEVKMAEG